MLTPKASDGPRMSAPRAPPVDHATIAEYLGALAYPLRLQLLEELRFPHTLSEIRVTPHRREAGQTPDRPAARQTVQLHLDTLVDADLVRSEPFEQDGRVVPRYVVNSPKLYEVTEELRRLTLRYAGRGPSGDATGTLESTAPAVDAKGARLVLVHGLYEGKVFPLAPGGAGTWIVGRRRDAPVSLDYDPFVSVDHAVVTAEGARFAVADLGSKNGTLVNWGPVEGGKPRALRSGDVLTVGRSHLVFIGE